MPKIREKKSSPHLLTKVSFWCAAAAAAATDLCVTASRKDCLKNKKHLWNYKSLHSNLNGTIPIYIEMMAKSIN